MGCGASNDTLRIQTPIPLNKKPVLPAIESQTKTKTKSPSAKSNGSTDSGIEDSEPIKTVSNTSKLPVPIENFHVEHHQKSRLGHGETFEIIAAPKPGSLAPLRHVPKFLVDNKETPTVDPDLQAKLAAKQERASRKRQELEDARRSAASRIGHRTTNSNTTMTTKKSESFPITTNEPFPPQSKRDERQQQLAMLRDKLRRTGSNGSLYESMHTPRTSRPDSVTSGMTDIGNMTPRRGALVVGATTASNFKPVYD